MQVIDLLFRQELNLRLHVIGDLARPIRWVHASDSRDPAPYLNGEEVVLSTGAWFNGKESVTRFVAGLMKANVAALGFGVHDDMPTVPMELNPAAPQPCSITSTGGPTPCPPQSAPHPP